MTVKDVGVVLKQLEKAPIEDWPHDAPQVVAEGLESPDLEIRTTAARLAWPMMTDEIAEKLERLAEVDDDEELRAAAVIAFGPVIEEMEDDGIVEDSPVSGGMLDKVRAVLRRLHEDEAQPKLVRRRALEASVRGGEPWHADAVTAAWALDDEDWKVTALFCMGYMPGFDEVVVAAVHETEGDVRLQAIQAAGMRALAEVGPTVLALAADEDADTDLRVEAIFAVAAIRVDGAAELLMSLADADDEEVADAAIAALDELYEALDDEELEGEWDEDEEEDEDEDA